jgi:hypothetical protein
MSAFSRRDRPSVRRHQRRRIPGGGHHPRTDNYLTLNLARVHDTADYEYFGAFPALLRIGPYRFQSRQTPGATVT